MPPIAPPGRLLRRELAAHGLSANRLALDLQSQYDIAVAGREHGAMIAQRVKPADAA